jgi:hypothetical protein
MNQTGHIFSMEDGDGSYYGGTFNYQDGAQHSGNKGHYYSHHVHFSPQQNFGMIIMSIITQSHQGMKGQIATVKRNAGGKQIVTMATRVPKICVTEIQKNSCT